MVKFVKTCKVCNAIKKDEKLAKRIYDSKQYVKGGEPLTDIAEAYAGTFSYQGLYNHCKMHQNPSEGELIEKRLQKVAKDTTEARVSRVVRHGEFTSSVLEKAQELLDAGELKGMTLSAALKAASLQASVEQKEADRQQAFMAMIAKFTSGEIQRIPGEEGFRINGPQE